MATYSTQGKDVLLDGKVVASGVDAESAIRMAQKSATKAGGVFSPTPVSSPQQPTTTPITPLATTAPATQPPSPQPSTKQYYAVGQDLYEAGTNRYIGATEWGRDWTGRATKVEAPTSQAVTATTTPPEIAETQPPVYTTGTTRAEEATTQQQAQQFTTKMQTDFGGSYGIPPVDQSIYTPFAQTQKGAQEEAKLTYAEEALKAVRAGTYTPEQQAQIEGAIRATEAAYAPLIREAEQAKTQGLPNAEVLAGQLGGFMNTQFAGLAALVPTEGGNFRGAGGELERIASAYDQNIANAKSAAQRAIEEAKSRAISAINTGAREDYELATIAYDRAKSAHDESIALSRQKTEDLINWAVKSQELQKYRQETASKTLDTMASAGYEREDIPDWYFEELDKSSGYMPGTSQAMFEVTKQAKVAETLEQEMEAVKNIVAIQKDLPFGASVTINGVTYESFSKGEINTGSEMDANGNLTVWSYNQDTGEVSTKKIDGVGVANWPRETLPNGTIIAVSPDGTQRRVVYNANDPSGGVSPTGGIFTAFPEGSISPFTRPNDPNKDLATECGAWVNDITGIGVGNTYQSKVDKMDPSITAETARIGDVIIQPIGDTGHIAIINDIQTLQDGSKIYTISESNWKKQPGTNGTVGLITHTRQITEDQVTGYARPGFKDPSYNFGTDAIDPYATSVGITDKQKESFTKLDAVKSLESGRELRQAMVNYFNYLEDKGKATISASQKKMIDNLYATAVGALKKAETLGTLDKGLLDYAKMRLPDPKDLKGFDAILKNENARRKALSESIGSIDTMAKTYYDDILSQYPEYESYDYLNKLISDYGYEVE
jgi:hypothetical protein